jgi:hypothetical protein
LNYNERLSIFLRFYLSLFLSLYLRLHLNLHLRLSFSFYLRLYYLTHFLIVLLIMHLSHPKILLFFFYVPFLLGISDYLRRLLIFEDRRFYSS